eukprot:CAMPEP_0196654012 /NCGR_PEP_ID=MMETSP1086-20130531/3688_1 /TAXON_ID=77921 /ORGANISM="Cyanoptyche  gloeocystis , Strain SAG4.97" /LENGTH=101 /DNA_ID=CAMNT_0041985523 /DNA_START=215 /DNA_END=520 /DNA_ORIENTATION=+
MHRGDAWRQECKQKSRMHGGAGGKMQVALMRKVDAAVQLLRALQQPPACFPCCSFFLQYMCRKQTRWLQGKRWHADENGTQEEGGRGQHGGGAMMQVREAE